MKVLIAGATGLVGTALTERLHQGGDEVVRLSRSDGAGTVRWNPAAGELDPAALEGVDAVVNLAGESILGLWTTAKRERIRASRVAGTQLLSRTLAGMSSPPSVLVNASAIGIYGDRGDTVCREDTPPGDDFLAQVSADWEEATQVAQDAGIRVVKTRIGMVLSLRGGALATMLPAFRMGVGGRLGNGRQYVSWITLEDLVCVIDTSIRDAALRGAINAVAPNPVTNREFTRTLGSVLRRPTVIPVPALAVRLLMGQMGKALLLASTRVEPSVLTAHGFSFGDADLDGALHRLLADG